MNNKFKYILIVLILFFILSALFFTYKIVKIHKYNRNEVSQEIKSSDTLQDKIVLIEQIDNKNTNPITSPFPTIYCVGNIIIVLLNIYPSILTDFYPQIAVRAYIP